MPLSYDFIEKPPQVQLVDRFFSGPPAQLKRSFATARSLLTQPGTLDQTTAQLAGGAHPGVLADLTSGDVDHFRNHWLSQGSHPPHPWAGPDVERIMRDAYLDAVNAADRDPPVPIETFWVFSPIERLEMRVSESDDRITVFVLIPKTDEIQFDADQQPADRRIRSFGPGR